MLIEQRWPAAAQHQSQNERDEDRVVQLTRDRDEVRNQVDGQCRVAD